MLANSACRATNVKQAIPGDHDAGSLTENPRPGPSESGSIEARYTQATMLAEPQVTLVRNSEIACEKAIAGG